MSESTLSGLFLWLTRPGPENARSRKFWQSHGATASSVPLLGIECLPIPSEQIAELSADPPDHVVFTSARAVENLLANLAKQPTLEARLRHLPSWTVGSRTAEFARSEGFADVRENPGKSAHDLAEHMRKMLSPGESIFFPAARQRRPELPELLGAAGFSLREWAVYDTVRLPLPDEGRRKELLSSPPPLLLAYSPTAAAAIRSTLEEVGARAPVATLGASTRSAARAEGLEVVASSAFPSEESLLEALAGWWAKRDRSGE